MCSENKCQITAIIAMSLDGKISTDVNTRATFTSRHDFHHLETQVSLCDAVIFGANTLKAYGTSLAIKEPHLFKEREARRQPPQPLHLVCSPSGNLQPEWAFFSQPLPRGLITTSEGLHQWQENLRVFSFKHNLDMSDNQLTSILNVDNQPYFHQVFLLESSDINWGDFLKTTQYLNLNKIAILGGSKLISSFLKEGLIDDLWITICPLLIGKVNSPSFLSSYFVEDLSLPIRLKLLEVENIEEEIFAHYAICY